MNQHTTERIKKRYNRNAKIYDVMDRMMSTKERIKLLEDVHGDVLEVGIGTGMNLPYYPDNVSLTGIDFSEKMLKKAEAKVAALGMENRVKLLEMNAEQMTFESDTFDTIVTSCVFCSVPDPVKGMKEMKRVLKPDGRILMLEHMRSEQPVIGRMMDLVNPLVVGVWGANINRDTMSNIKEAGLKVTSEHRVMGTMMRRLEVQKETT